MRLDGKTGLAIKAVCALLLLLVAAVCPAANTDGVGLNTQLIQEYYWYLNGNCTAYQSQLNAGAGCPSNAMGHSLDQISRIIQDLVVNQHVTTFREVVPLALMSPAGTNDPTGAAMATDATNYALMDAILGLFETHGVHLILALGDPVPNWAVPWAVPYGNRYGCFLPSSATDFQTFKNNLSWTVGNYLQHLSQLSPAFKAWMQGRGSGGLWVEGFNEWNAERGHTAGGCTSEGTAAQAAQLEQGIDWVANTHFRLGVLMAAPSVAVTLSPASTGSLLAGWYTRYYKSYGGGGAPNVHIYTYAPAAQSAGAAAVAIATVQRQLHTLIGALPAPYNAQIILGETGYAGSGSDPRCGNGSTDAMNPGDWSLYNLLATAMVTGLDTEIAADVQLMTIWRLDQFTSASAAQTSCQNFYGVVDPQLKTYQPAGINMFRYLGGTGASP